MKRSEINAYIEEAIDVFGSANFKLPPFAFWSPERWRQKGTEANEIWHNGLGWDVTDYGLGRFFETGLLLFTIRNGNYTRKDIYPKGYAEKIMVVKEKQVTPYHYHMNKREDIINRGGGDLVLELFLADEQDGLSDQGFSVTVDGIQRKVQPGGSVILTPGESICLEPYVYHTFCGKPGTGTVIVGEVSDVNDDARDNIFLEKVGRFPDITEDEPVLYYLCHEYPQCRNSGDG